MRYTPRQIDSQFRETSWEREERWREMKAKRRAEGKCWQCAKLIAECTCPNVNHVVGQQPRASGIDAEETK